MNRAKIAVGSMLGALALHVVMVACGAAGPSAPGDAGVLADVRDAIADVMQDVVAAETPDAHAGGGPAMELACDVTSVQRIIQTGGMQEYTSHYAAVPTAATGRDVPDIRAVVCDPVEDTSPCRPYAGNPSVTCIVTGQPIGPTTCTQATVIFDAGRVLVPCGSTYVSTSSTSTMTGGYRYRRAFVRLP